MKQKQRGIYKLPVQEPVEIKSLGIQRDFICDQKNRGGPDQAIYIYGTPDYAWWSKELGRELSAGTFGDNLTVSELESAGRQKYFPPRLAGVYFRETSSSLPSFGEHR